MKRGLQATRTDAQDGAGAGERTRQPDDLLRTDEACDYLRYRGKHRLRSLYRFLKAKGVKTKRRSARCLLIKQSELDRALDGGRRRSSLQSHAGE